jgi:hypothetical protein
MCIKLSKNFNYRGICPSYVSSLYASDKMPNSAPLSKHRRAAVKKSPVILSHDGTFKSFWNWLLLFVTLYVVVVDPYNASFFSTVRRSMISSVVIASFFTMGKYSCGFPLY